MEVNQSSLEVVQTAVEYAQKLEAGILQAAEYYRNGELGKGHEYVALITDGIEWLINVITLTRNELSENIDVIAVNGLIGEYIEAAENDDTVLMADLLEYEIAEEVKNWQIVLSETVSKNTGV